MFSILKRAVLRRVMMPRKRLQVAISWPDIQNGANPTTGFAIKNIEAYEFSLNRPRVDSVLYLRCAFPFFNVTTPWPVLTKTNEAQQKSCQKLLFYKKKSHTKNAQKKFGTQLITWPTWLSFDKFWEYQKKFWDTIFFFFNCCQTV